MSVTNIMIVKGYHITAMTPQLADVVTGQLGGGWLPIGAPQNTDLYGEASQTMVKVDSGEVSTGYQLVKSSGPTVAVPGTGWEAIGDATWVETGTWLQAFVSGMAYGDIIDLATQVTGVLALANGGTGASDAAQARVNLGLGTAATYNVGNNGSDVPILSGANTWTGLQTFNNGAAIYPPLTLTSGGTGASDAVQARLNLGLGSSATYNVGTSGNVVPLLSGNNGWSATQVFNGGVMINPPLPLTSGGTGRSAPFGTASGTFCQGNDNRLNTIDGKTGGGVIGHTYFKIVQDTLPANGCIVASTTQSSTGITPAQLQMFCQIGSGGQRYGFLRLWQDSSYKDWYLDYSSGNAYAPASWVDNSDERIKDQIERIRDPLEKMRLIKGCTWVRKDDQSFGNPGIGFIAQDVLNVFPQMVSKAREGSLTVNGEVVTNPLAIDAGGIAAALHHEAILVLMAKIEALEKKLADAGL